MRKKVYLHPIDGNSFTVIVHKKFILCSYFYDKIEYIGSGTAGAMIFSRR